MKKNSIKKQITHPKLIIFLVVLLIIPAVMFSYNKYKDWDNAQLIKGLARDFPALVSEIEQATGLELEQKVDCSITTEKFSSGVRTCELYASATNTLSEKMEEAKQAVISSTRLSSPEEYMNNKGYSLQYREKKSCGIGLGARGSGILSFSCITAVREANIDLAREVFLNQ